MAKPPCEILDGLVDLVIGFQMVDHSFEIPEKRYAQKPLTDDTH